MAARTSASSHLLGGHRIGQRLPQRAERKVRPLRQRQHACALRQADNAVAERPDAGKRAEEARLARAGRAAHQQVLAGRKAHRRQRSDRLARAAGARSDPARRGRCRRPRPGCWRADGAGTSTSAIAVSNCATRSITAFHSAILA